MNQINVQAKEIHEWLCLRRKLDKFWGQQHKAIKLKQSSILKKIKTDVILPKVQNFFKTQKKEEKEINFLNLIKLNEILINSEEGKKRNFFNQYSSQYIIDLQALIKIFKKKFIHIASLAQELNQKINHELPGMKRLLKNNERQIKDFEFKSSSYFSSLVNSKKEILKLVEKYVPDFELIEEEVENFNLDDFLDNFVFEITPKVEEILGLVEKTDFLGFIEFYKKFSFFNNEESFAEDYFKELEDFKNKGHFCLEGENVENPMINYLNSKGYYKDQNEKVNEIIDIDWQIEEVEEETKNEDEKSKVEWEIEEIGNDTEKKIISKNTNLTDRTNRERILQLLYEVF